MFDPRFDAFVGVHSARLFAESSGRTTAGFLLWGDGVRLTGQARNGRVPVRSRGRSGWVEESALNGGKSLLEVYFIDVGQGDGVLIKTPDFRHIMIDGGHPRQMQNTGKSAADFVDWKFFEDYGSDRIELDAMIASHNDLDHYGGLADLLDAAQEAELDAKSINVEAFYHAGISWWVDPDTGRRTLGETIKEDGDTYYVQLLEDRRSAMAALDPDGRHRLQGTWGDFIEKVAISARQKTGRPTPIARLSHLSKHLPGFAPRGDGPAIAVLGPIESNLRGRPGLPRLGAESRTANGNSILLRLDYGRARILLTGDLNKDSQRLLLKAYAGRRLEFQCDVAKACHHGSEDVSFAFLQAMAASATVISSGDAEGHDHPRPQIVAASGAAGHLTVDGDEIITPLVYSTELARSVSLGRPGALEIDRGLVDENGPMRIETADLHKVVVEFTETKPGDLRPRTKRKRLSQAHVVAGLVYGLVNVRTDGDTILTATMNENDGSWSEKSFPSRF
ncbi:ComEC/Rec2 family competence protein [Belnapia rosea]|uniref:Metallo-beta-lactamase superfamily protein n=1 Tax=Belnapia rosea TaxID=938405 RepID=A0A1G6YWS4_9PROT|nr:MBL fold metallo-hydrolase [Belnapia rosea]SDD94788.1 Metallo-beta-lactamase superfamily protein [Belnapia rosea]